MQFMMVGSRGDYPIINIEEIHMIFYKVEELQAAHKNFYKQLEPRLTQWSKNQIIGDLFEDLVRTVTLCTLLYFLYCISGYLPYFRLYVSEMYRRFIVTEH